MGTVGVGDIGIVTLGRELPAIEVGVVHRAMGQGADEGVVASETNSPVVVEHAVHHLIGAQVRRQLAVEVVASHHEAEAGSMEPGKVAVEVVVAHVEVLEISPRAELLREPADRAHPIVAARIADPMKDAVQTKWKEREGSASERWVGVETGGEEAATAASEREMGLEEGARQRQLKLTLL